MAEYQLYYPAEKEMEISVNEVCNFELDYIIIISGISSSFIGIIISNLEPRI